MRAAVVKSIHYREASIPNARTYSFLTIFIDMSTNTVGMRACRREEM